MPSPGPHGGDGAVLARALGVGVGEILDLSASLNPVATDPGPIVAAHLDALGRYPDPVPATAALADAVGVATDRILLTNGGAEAIALVAADAGRGWVDDPDFSLYRRHLPTVAAGAPRWRSDPHNPSGRLAPPDEEAAVWDEAFYPLATGRWISDRADRGAIVLGSLTKLFACPGLRAGFVVAEPETVARLAGRQPRWSVNGLVCAALPALLATAELERWSKEIAVLRDDLGRLLGDHGYLPAPSDANYVLVGNADGLRDRLGARGIAVRDCASFGLPGHVRIAVPDNTGLERLEAALA